MDEGTPPPPALLLQVCHACLFCLREVFLAGLGVSQCTREDCVYMRQCPGPLCALFWCLRVDLLGRDRADNVSHEQAWKQGSSQQAQPHP